MEIRDDETLEKLQPGGFLLFQKKNGFRFGMDSVLLAEFALIRKNDSVADFGTGSCILPFLLLSRGKGNTFQCIEIQQEMAEMAERSVKINHLEEKIRIIHGDAEDAAKWIPPSSLDAVICNPPYAAPGTAISSPYLSRAISRNQSDHTMQGFFKSAFRILKGKGRISIVYPAVQMLQAMQQLREAHLEPKRFQMIYPCESRPANLVLIEAVKDAKPLLHPMPPLIVYTEEHHLTSKLRSVYHMEEQN